MKPHSVGSPCIRHCCLNDDNICLGCFRSMTEIIGWGEADDAERRKVLNNAATRLSDHQIKYPRVIE